ncbi:hypothetical protein ACHAXR_011907, partial [Thalassiosira sp. AJA248-18]
GGGGGGFEGRDRCHGIGDGEGGVGTIVGQHTDAEGVAAGNLLPVFDYTGSGGHIGAGLGVLCALFSLLILLATGSRAARSCERMKRNRKIVAKQSCNMATPTFKLLFVLLFLTASLAAEISDEDSIGESWTPSWNMFKAIFSTSLTTSSGDAAAQDMPQNGRYRFLLRTREPKDDNPNQKDCELDEVYVDRKCSKMQEFGFQCKSDDVCLSGNCIERRCGCPEFSDCWGCASTDAPCFRIEQTDPLQRLQVCRLAATLRGKPNRQFKLFSGGGKTVLNTPGGYKSLPKMVISESQSAEIQCSEFSPFLMPPEDVMPPAFAQANILASKADDVYELVVSGPFAGLLNSLVFLEGNWISTIHEGHRPTSNEDKAIVPVWPRQRGTTTATAIGVTTVIEIGSSQPFDFNIARGHGVEFIGTTDTATVIVQGGILMEGRLSFKNVTISFESGSITTTGPMIFQSSDVVGLYRCPPLFQELAGLCVHANGMLDQADDAVETCSFFDRGFLPSYDDILDVGAHKLLHRGESMWIAPFDGGTCTLLNEDGTISSYPIDDGSACEEYNRVLCAASIKEAIKGQRYTSYLSNQIISNHRELFHRIVDPQRLPIQLGGKLTVYQQDGFRENDNGEFVSASYTVSDELPTALSVVVNLASGNQGDIHVALDSFDEPSYAHPHTWDFEENSSILPSKIQIHATNPVCVSSVDLLFRNKTGADHLVLQIPVTLFEGCLDFNVCDDTNPLLCGRSIMHFDKSLGCAVLQMEGAIYPARDLSLSIFDGWCNRLTSWSHPSLGEPFMIELARDLQPAEDINLYELSSDRNNYTFTASNSATSQVLDENEKLPTVFRLRGGSGARIKSVSVTRYGKVISGVDFSSLWDCINVCPAIADTSGLLLGENMTEVAVLDLLDPIACRKLTAITTKGGNKDGRQACTSPHQNISSIDDLNDIMTSLLNPHQPYRTLSAMITGKVEGDGIVEIPTNRGLSIFVDPNAIDGASISAADFRIFPLAECYLDGATLNGTTSVSVERDGLLEMSSCDIVRGDELPLFLLNAGKAILTSVDVLKSTKLQNVDAGHLDLTYVEFQDRSTLENSDGGTLELSRLQLYETFTLPLKTIGPGSRFDARSLSPYNELSQRRLAGAQVILQEAARLYHTLDDENDPLCQGSEAPDLTLQLSSEECRDRCEDEFVCSGILVYFDEDNNAQCDLCLRDTECAFNCSAVNSVYYKATSNFYYTSVSACPALSRPFEPLEGASLEECKLYCSWYKTCEGFRIDSDPAENKIKCHLYADLDFDDKCTTSDSEIIGDSCLLYASNDFRRSQDTTGLHISVDNIFPKKVYMKYLVCRIEAAYADYNTKTRQRCQMQCDSDLSCAAFSFVAFQSHGIANCKLHDLASIIDEVFEEKDGCEKGEVGVAYATESFVETSLEQLRFNPLSSVNNLLADECKSLCLFDADCVAVRYLAFDISTNSSSCTVGQLSAGSANGPSNDEVLILEARSSDIGSQYVAAQACYEGEELTLPKPTEVSRAYGYVRWPKACTSTAAISSSNFDGATSPADCGLRCDQTNGCGGFVYYVNYTGPYNVDKIGKCELIGEEISIGTTCDAIEQNSDIHLRADLGSVCEAACNIHHLCSSFVAWVSPSTSGGIDCKLYSDVALFDTCPDDQIKTSVHIGLSYRERDALVEAKGQCFIDFEDNAEIGCYGPSFPSEPFIPAKNLFSKDDFTPHHCQQHCKALGKPFYAVSEGTECYCSSTLDSDLAFSSTNCTTACNGDVSQTCGGHQYALIGSTDIPKKNLTLSQCKRECFEDQKCEAIVFDEANNECELRSSALFETCDTLPQSRRAFIESFEHYYEPPKYSYIGSEVLYTTSIDLQPDCQKLCDAFLRCEAIHFDETTNINNCKLLGGDIVRLGPNESADGVLVARDVTLFTKGFSPDSQELTRISAIFDIDECKALCEAHAACGAMVFSNRLCILWPRSGFAGVEEDASPATPHYLDFKAFVDLDQDISKAPGLCIDESGGMPQVLSSHMTAQSVHDCAARCNDNFDCRLFTYNEGTSSDCKLYGNDVKLKDACLGIQTTTYILYTRGQFTEKKHACLKDEAYNFLLTHKNVVECAALCDAWFNCRSFRIDQETGECRLHEQEQYIKDLCTGSEPLGDLYVYYSDFFFVRLSEHFCVASNSIIGDVLEDIPLEACKTICDKHELCVALEHNQNSECALYSSSDFSIPCSQNSDRVLYIGYKDVVESKNKYEYKPMQDCFGLADSEWVTVSSEVECQDLCTENCLGYQYSHPRCHTLFTGALPPISECDTDETFSFRVERYPYQKMKNTCLRNEIYNTDENRIYDTEEYECLALCDAHPFCRYYLYGVDTGITELEVRECKLFKAQAQELDCKKTQDYNGKYGSLTAFVNGRTFVDQVTWFGEPESTYAVLSGLSYQECASSIAV